MTFQNNRKTDTDVERKEFSSQIDFSLTKIGFELILSFSAIRRLVGRSVGPQVAYLVYLVSVVYVVGVFSHPLLRRQSVRSVEEKCGKEPTTTPPTGEST